jgi:hypothetical protein
MYRQALPCTSALLHLRPSKKTGRLMIEGLVGEG